MIQKTSKSQKGSEYPKLRTRPMVTARSSKLLKARLSAESNNVLKPNIAEEIAQNDKPTASSLKHKPSVSIEFEQRYAIVTVSQVSRTVHAFRLEYKADGVDYSKWPKIARDVLEDVNANELDVESYADFKLLLRGFKMKKIFKRPTEYEHLEHYCEKGIRFEQIAAQSRQRLEHIYENNMNRYFLSFSDEAEELVKAAKDYQEKITRYKDNIQITIRSLDEAMEEFWHVRLPLVSGYLGKAVYVNDLMDNVCRIIGNLCDFMKQWTHDDRQYPARLWDEIITNNLQRSRLIENVKKLTRKRQDMLRHRHNKQVNGQCLDVMFTFYYLL